jgi:hypothetical protein
LPLGAPAVFHREKQTKTFFLDNDAGKMVSKSVYYSNVREEHKAIKVAELYCLPGIVMLKKKRHMAATPPRQCFGPSNLPHPPSTLG